MPIASTEAVFLPLPPGAPPWFAAYHLQLLGLLQRNQQRIDEARGLRGRPSISAPLQAFGQRLEGVGEASASDDALTQAQAASLLEAFTPTFLGQPHTWTQAQTFSSGLILGHETLSVYDEGTFTATGTGFGTPPTATAHYVRIGKAVLLEVPQLSGTSNATTFTITGMPAGIQPAYSSYHFGAVTDNGVDGYGFIFLAGGTNVLHVFINTVSGIFTASGTKRVYPQQLAYLLA
jgi:hypothetical protein